MIAWAMAEGCAAPTVAASDEAVSAHLKLVRVWCAQRSARTLYWSACRAFVSISNVVHTKACVSPVALHVCMLEVLMQQCAVDTTAFLSVCAPRTPWTSWRSSLTVRIRAANMCTTALLAGTAIAKATIT
eukprot:769-Heterococcus_DN1.PRE.2